MEGKWREGGIGEVEEGRGRGCGGNVDLRLKPTIPRGPKLLSASPAYSLVLVGL